MRREHKLYGSLPTQYQQVEYIQSSGAQYIDTGYGLNVSTDILEVSFMPTQAYCSILLGGGLYSTSNGEIYVGSPSVTGDIFTVITHVSSSAARTQDHAASSLMNQWNVLKIENKIPYLNSIAYSATKSINTSYNLYLFCLNRGGSIVLPGYFKVGYYRHIRNNIMIRNFIPCYRKSDNKPGLYDLISHSFFINQNSGTDFTIGHIIN